MRLAFVTRHSDLKRLDSFEPDAYVLLDPVDIGDRRVISKEELPSDVVVIEEPPLGILDDMQGSLEIREIMFELKPKYVIFYRPELPGYAYVDGIMFINASLGAVIDGRVYIPRNSHARVLYSLYPDTPRGFPLEEPARIRAYKKHEDPHLHRIAMFARAYMERRVLIREPKNRTKLDEFLSLRDPVFFDLEFDARALKKGYLSDDPIIWVASYTYGHHLRRVFIRTLQEERSFLEELSTFDEIVGYGTSGDERILRLAAEKHDIDLPKVKDLRSMLFPKIPEMQRIALPVGRKMGLKAVATALGFRRSTDKDGYRAFKTYLKAKKRSWPKYLVEELIRYNIEDTIMTEFVYREISKELQRNL